MQHSLRSFLGLRLRLETCGFSPASAGSELTAPFCLEDRRWLSGQKGDIPRLHQQRNTHWPGRRAAPTAPAAFMRSQLYRLNMKLADLPE